MRMQRSKELIRTGLIGLFLFVPVFSVADVSGGTNDPKLLFEKMRQAKSSVFYSGSLAYERGEQLFSYSVDSANQTGSGVKILESLSGAPQTYEFRGKPGCLEPDEFSIEQLSDWYNFSYVGPSRVAGRDAHEITLRPVDPYRLGYSFVIDQQTGLMLRSLVMQPDRRVSERMQFVQLEISEVPVVETTAESAETHDFSELEDSADQASSLNEASDVSDLCQSGESVSSWDLNWTPEGFRILWQDQLDQQNSLVYGDGIAIFSLFVEPVEQILIPAGSTQQGATTLMINYYAVRGATYMVTFVGEVPLATAERVLSGLNKIL